MKYLILFLTITSILSYYDIENHKKIVSFINKLRTTWKAKLFNKDTSTLLGSWKQPESSLFPERKTFYASRSYLPDNYDLRKEYPYCQSLQEIYNQSYCSSSYAISSSQTISDRICIHTGGKLQTRISATDIITCCSECGKGCIGGLPNLVFNYWINNGIPSGGLYGDNNTCKPYFLKPGNDNSNNIKITPECENKCQEKYNKSSEEDKSYGINAFILKGEENIMKEIFENGPVVSSFNIYEDFFDYEKGIYQHITGHLIGKLSIRIIGWGITEDGIKYWICSNSWGDTWGEKGFFRILKGENECGIEEQAVTGMPKI